LPTGIYTIPEIGTVGALESSLVHSGVDYVVGRGRYETNARARIIGDLDGLLKVLFRRDDMTVLGVHVVGDQATELVHLGMVAMLGRLTASALEQACFNVPTLGELYVTAARDALDRRASIDTP
jgi:NAD(P) transhydrogenase